MDNNYIRQISYIKDRIKEDKIKLKDLNKYLNINRISMYRYLSLKSVIPLDVFLKICTYLEINVSIL